MKILMPVRLVTNLIITLNVVILFSQVNLTEVVSLMTYVSFSRKQLIQDQELDSEIRCLAEGAVSEEEAAINPKCYYKKGGVLMRKWRPPDAPANEKWHVVHQII